jgi:hypothetical protein
MNQDRAFVWQGSSSLKQDEICDDDSDSDKGILLMAGILNEDGTTGHHVAEYSRCELIYYGSPCCRILSV